MGIGTNTTRTQLKQIISVHVFCNYVVLSSRRPCARVHLISHKSDLNKLQFVPGRPAHPPPRLGRVGIWLGPVGLSVLQYSGWAVGFLKASGSAMTGECQTHSPGPPSARPPPWPKASLWPKANLWPKAFCTRQPKG